MDRFGEMVRWHLRREWLRLLLLALALAFFTGFLVAISKSVQPRELQELYEKLPPALVALVGFEKGMELDMGYWLAIVHNHPVWLILTLSFCFAAGLRGIAGGVADGTLEPVLAQPISRTTYYLSLALLVSLGTTGVAAASFGGGILTGQLVELPGALPIGVLVRMSFSGAALALAVSGIVLLVSATGGNRPTTWAISIVVAMFFLRFLADVWPTADWVAPLSLFHYHQPREIVRSGLSPGSIAVLLGIWLACTTLGLLVFRRRQLTF